jgi:hypothetical protein
MTSIEIGGAAASATDIKQAAFERNAKKPTLAKQKATRRNQAGEGNLHAVDRTQGKSLKQEAGAAHSVDLGPQRNWRRAYSLPSFPDPPGFVLCWVARHKRRHGDDANLLSSLREGWMFVKPEEIDEEDLPTESFTGRLAKHGDVIGDETTVLMKLPEHMKAQRDAFYNTRRDQATRAVTRRKPGLAEATPQMPLVEDRNEVSVDFARMRARRPARPEAAEAD